MGILKPKASWGRIGKFIVVQAEGLSHFETKPPGRVRIVTPRWRRPPCKKRLYLTTITVRARGTRRRLSRQTDRYVPDKAACVCQDSRALYYPKPASCR